MNQDDHERIAKMFQVKSRRAKILDKQNTDKLSHRESMDAAVTEEIRVAKSMEAVVNKETRVRRDISIAEETWGVDIALNGKNKPTNIQMNHKIRSGQNAVSGKCHVTFKYPSCISTVLCRDSELDEMTIADGPTRKCSSPRRAMSELSTGVCDNGWVNEQQEGKLSANQGQNQGQTPPQSPVTNCSSKSFFGRTALMSQQGQGTLWSKSAPNFFTPTLPGQTLPF